MARPRLLALPGTRTTARVASLPSSRQAPGFILWLAIVALTMQALDLVSALRMISTHGLSYELNPVARSIVALGGLAGLSVIKLGAVLIGVLLFIWVGRYGRARLAASALILAATVGAFGFYSNQV